MNDHAYTYYPYEVALSNRVYWGNMTWDDHIDRIVNPMIQWFHDYRIDIQWEQRGEGEPMKVEGHNFVHYYKNRQPAEWVFLFHRKREARLFAMRFG